MYRKIFDMATLTERLAFFNVLDDKVMFAVAEIAHLCVGLRGSNNFWKYR